MHPDYVPLTRCLWLTESIAHRIHLDRECRLDLKLVLVATGTVVEAGQDRSREKRKEEGAVLPEPHFSEADVQTTAQPLLFPVYLRVPRRAALEVASPSRSIPVEQSSRQTEGRLISGVRVTKGEVE